jgi:hypothetical protein
MAYCLELPTSMVEVHNVFHVSQLKKCLKVPIDVIVDDVAHLDADLSYPEHSMKLLGKQCRVMRRRIIHFYKDQWSYHSEKEDTWETENFVHSNYVDFLHLQ